MEQPQEPKAPVKNEQQIFDEQVARASAKVVLWFGGLAILAALAMSTIALVNSSGKSTTTTVTASPDQTAGDTGAATGGSASTLTGAALGKQLFVSGDPSVGVIACGSCHTLSAAGTSSTIGPNLDKELKADPASAALESIVAPNKEIIKGFPANLMPKNYGTSLTKPQLDALVKYVYDNTNTKAKAAAATSP